MAKSVIYVDTAAKYGDYLSSMGKKGEGKLAIENEKKLVFLMSLRNIIKEQGWKPSRLAREMGAKPSWLTRILKGQRGMNIFDFFYLCEIIGVPPEKLLAGFPSTIARNTEAEEVAERMNPYIPDDVWKALLKVREKQNKS